MVIREEALAGAAPGGVSISHLVLRKRRNEVLEKTERRLSLSSSSIRTTKIRKIQGISVTTNEQPPSRASAGSECTSRYPNCFFPIWATNFPISNCFLASKRPISKYHLGHVRVVTFANRSQRVPRLVKSALALVCNARLNGSIR